MLPDMAPMPHQRDSEAPFTFIMLAPLTEAMTRGMLKNSQVDYFPIQFCKMCTQRGASAATLNLEKKEI